MTAKDKTLDTDLIDVAEIYAKLDALSDIEQIKVATRLIETCRDVLMVDLATIRRRGAAKARARGMRPRDIAEESQSSVQTINRLLAEAHVYEGGR